MNSQYKRKDHLYVQAKEEGYKSRAAYKLKEIQEKYKILKPAGKVLDVGAWPGGWSQVALEYIGQQGRVVSIDTQKMDDLGDRRLTSITGDASDEDVIQQAGSALGGQCDVLVSDMSPKLTGIKEVDNAATEHCSNLALSTAELLLKSGGSFVVKVFKNAGSQEFVKRIQPMFNRVVRAELKSSRNSSNEFYVIAFGFKAGQRSTKAN